MLIHDINSDNICPMVYIIDCVQPSLTRNNDFLGTKMPEISSHILTDVTSDIYLDTQLSDVSSDTCTRC
jgi:hypothetical protein